MAEPAIERKPERLVALDVFRGAIIALMVLVNTPGDGAHVYGPLQHAEWHGWTITDVVFPSFVFMVGISLTLSFARRIAAGASKAQLFRQALKRAAILYALGLIIYGFPRYDLGTLRMLGVLQRIAICYAIAAAIYLTAGIRGQVAWIAGLLVSYWMLMTLVPVPGVGPGDLRPDRNLANYIDRIVLGSHNYAGTRTWDPEGIVSTLPSIATALFGVLCGAVLRLRRELAERTAWLFFAGNLLLALGLILDMWMPINKKLWTTSFSVFMAGLDFVLFAVAIWVVDRLGFRRPLRPLVIMGMNAIAVYMASEMLDIIISVVRIGGTGADSMSVRRWIYQTLFAPLASPINASLLFAIAYVGLMWLLAYAMYRRNVFIRV